MACGVKGGRSELRTEERCQGWGESQTSPHPVTEEEAEAQGGDRGLEGERGEQGTPAASHSCVPTPAPRQMDTFLWLVTHPLDFSGSTYYGLGTREGPWLSLALAEHAKFTGSEEFKGTIAEGGRRGAGSVLWATPACWSGRI